MLVGERIIVKDLAEDLYDGQVLQKLFGKRRAACCSGFFTAGDGLLTPRSKELFSVPRGSPGTEYECVQCGVTDPWSLCMSPGNQFDMNELQRESQ